MFVNWKREAIRAEWIFAPSRSVRLGHFNKNWTNLEKMNGKPIQSNTLAERYLPCIRCHPGFGLASRRLKELDGVVHHGRPYLCMKCAPVIYQTQEAAVKTMAKTLVIPSVGGFWRH